MPIDFASALLSLALTAAIFGAGPLLLRLRKTPIGAKPLKYIHIGYTVVVALAFAAYDAINGYQISFFPALLWGSIFYWWNTRYFEKKFSPKLPGPSEPTAPAVEAQTEIDTPEPATEIAVSKPSARKAARPRALTVILCVVAALSIAGNVWQAVSYSGKSAEAAEEIRVLNNHLSQKDEAIKKYRETEADLRTSLYQAESRNDNMDEHLGAAIFLYNSIGFIVDGSSYYHEYNCPVFQAADEYWAHNIEYCQSLGFTPCPICW